jgi:hypothetical protein
MTDWRDKLDGFFKQTQEVKETTKEAEFSRFIHAVANPAFEELRDQLTKHGRQVTIRETESSAAVVVHYQTREELSYRLHGRRFPHGVLPYAEIRFRERKGLKMISVESMLRSGTSEYSIEDLTKEEVIKHFLDHYMRAIQPG